MMTERSDTDDLTLHNNDGTASTTNMYLDQLEQDSSQLQQKTAIFVDKKMGHYKAILQQKRNNIDALLETIKTKREALNKKQEDLDRYESIYGEVQAMEQQNKVLETQLDALQKRQSLKEQMAANSQKIFDEVKQKQAILARKAGLVIHSLQDDYLKFDFTLIDKHEPDKLFTFVIHLSEERYYKVVECDPMVTCLSTLVEDLNRDGNFGRFIKQMRQEFCKQTTPEIASSPTSQDSPSIQHTPTDTTLLDNPLQSASPPKTSPHSELSNDDPTPAQEIE